MTQKTFVYKNSTGKWVPGFASRQAAIEAALADGLTQCETASVTTEPPAYFIRFLAPIALQKMIDGMRDGEERGQVVDSRDAREALEKVAAARISDGGLKSEVQHLSRIRCRNARPNFLPTAST